MNYKAFALLSGGGDQVRWGGGRVSTGTVLPNVPVRIAAGISAGKCGGRELLFSLNAGIMPGGNRMAGTEMQGQSTAVRPAEEESACAGG